METEIKVFRTVARWIGESVVFLGAVIELALLATLLPGDGVNAPVAGVLVNMILVAGAAVLVASPLLFFGRARVRA